MTDTVTARRLLLDQTGIGASEVATIAEASPWQTPVELWLHKLGMDAGERADSPSMRAGRELERALLKLGAGIVGAELRHNRQTFTHPDWPAVPLYATPDGFDTHRTMAVEVKLVGHHFGDWAAGVPEYVNWQVQAQMACLPRIGQVLVLALIGGEPKQYRVDRNPELTERLPGMVRDWWQRYVLADIAPPALTPADEWAQLRARLKPAQTRAERLATTDEQATGHELLTLLRQREAVDTQVDILRRQLAQAAADSDVIGLGWSARWSERRSTNWRGVAEQARIPASLIDLHTTHNPTFTVRRTGEAEPND